MTIKSRPARAGRVALPGLVGAAVRAADGSGDLRLEGVAATTAVQRFVLRATGSAGAGVGVGHGLLGASLARFGRPADQG